jgi:hypothetical protein
MYPFLFREWQNSEANGKKSVTFVIPRLQWQLFLLPGSVQLLLERYQRRWIFAKIVATRCNLFTVLTLSVLPPDEETTSYASLLLKELLIVVDTLLPPSID